MLWNVSWKVWPNWGHKGFPEYRTLELRHKDVGVWPSQKRKQGVWESRYTLRFHTPTLWPVITLLSFCIGTASCCEDLRG